VEALQRVIGGDVVGLGDERGVARPGDDELMRQALGVGEAQEALVALRVDAGALQAVVPERDRVLGRHTPLDRVDHAVPRAAGGRVGELEEGQDGAGGARLVPVVEVVHVRLVEVHGLLDHAQPQQPGVELDVARGVTRDRRDVMETFELHRASFLVVWGS
jgi:hypothetical protein